MGSYVKGIIFIILLLFFITFGVKNSQPIQLNYFLETLNVTFPLYGIIYIAILVGIFIGMAMGFTSRLNLRKTIKSMQNEKREIKETIQEEKEDSTEGT